MKLLDVHTATSELYMSPKFAHILKYLWNCLPVRHGADAVLKGLQFRLEGQLGAGVRDESLAEVVAAVADKVEDAPDRVLGEEGLLVQVHDPVVVAQPVKPFESLNLPPKTYMYSTKSTKPTGFGRWSCT